MMIKQNGMILIWALFLLSLINVMMLDVYATLHEQQIAVSALVAAKNKLQLQLEALHLLELNVHKETCIVQTSNFNHLWMLKEPLSLQKNVCHLKFKSYNFDYLQEKLSPHLFRITIQAGNGRKMQSVVSLPLQRQSLI